MRNNFNKGFTLVELLTVITILATIVTATVVIMNPIEMIRQAEDAVKLNDLNSIHQVLNLFRSNRPGGSIGVSNIVYISIPSDSPTCVGLGLPVLPAGWSYRCVTASDLRRIDGNGWIPVNFTAITGRIPLAILPIDPINTVASGNYYAYVTDGRTWALATMMGSQRHTPFAVRDGGTDSGRFEVGTDLSLWTSASGLVGYWSFDEGVGTTARDLSGRGNTGTLQPTLSPPIWTSGRVINALSFDGVDDMVDVPDTPLLDTVFGTNTVFTLEAWAFPRAWANWSVIINKATNGWFSNTTNGMWVDGSGFICVMGSNIDGNPAGSTISVRHNPPLNQWHHIACVADGANLIMYVSGAEVGRIALTGLTHTRSSNNTSLVFGRRCVGCPPSFNGNIDEVRIYNRALSAAEIRANFNATR